MNAHELAEKIRNKQGTYDELLKWCEKTVDNMDLNDPDYQYLYDRAISFMMQSRILNLTEKEATIITKYLSLSYLHEKGLDARVTVNMLDWENFVKRHKSDKLNGMCTTLKDTHFILDYSPNVIEGLMSSDGNKVLEALKVIYHETAHVIQESSIALTEINGKKVHYTSSLYEIALENTARKADSKFYDENYRNLVLENQANKVRTYKRLSSYFKICTSVKSLL